MREISKKFRGRKIFILLSAAFVLKRNILISLWKIKHFSFFKDTKFLVLECLIRQLNKQRDIGLLGLLDKSGNSDALGNLIDHRLFGDFHDGHAHLAAVELDA